MKKVIKIDNLSKGLIILLSFALALGIFSTILSFVHTIQIKDIQSQLDHKADRVCHNETNYELSLFTTNPNVFPHDNNDYTKCHFIFSNYSIIIDGNSSDCFTAVGQKEVCEIDNKISSDEPIDCIKFPDYQNHWLRAIPFKERC